jgi:hypothetical protein
MIGENDVMDAKTLAQVKMPNRDGDEFSISEIQERRAVRPVAFWRRPVRIRLGAMVFEKSKEADPDNPRHSRPHNPSHPKGSSQLSGYPRKADRREHSILTFQPEA